MKIYILIEETSYKREMEYICKLFSSLLDAHFIVQDMSYRDANKGPCIAYCQGKYFSFLPEFCRIKIIPNLPFWEGYLSKTWPNIKMVTLGEYCTFGPTGESPLLKFEQSGIITNLDLLSSSFFLITRFEELFNEGKYDTHGRYQFCNSILGEDLISQPIINIYARELSVWIERAYGIIVPFRQERMSAVISHDIDAPYYYLSLRAEISEIINSLHSVGKYKTLKDLKNYISFLIGNYVDPYDVFDYIREVEQARNIKSTYFILFSAENRWGLEKDQYSKQLKYLRSIGHEIALHPGYKSFSNPKRISNEKEAVKILSGQVPRGTRNHFLRFDLHRGYQMLEDLGFFYDSTLGYAEHEGFRAGICTPFKPFDIVNHRVIDIIEIPLIVMDSSLINYRGLQSDRAFDIIKSLIDNIWKVKGTVVFNWHNHLLTNKHVDWRNVYEKSIDYLFLKNAEFYTCIELAKKWNAYWA